ncbi:MAG: hypothetical protein AB7E79_06750 [Rhodospirillaceae bacterium]
MCAWRAVITALVVVAGAAEAASAGTLPDLDVGRLEIARAANLSGIPGERERPQALDGSSYAIVAPVYVGDGGFLSYLRLFNGGSMTATFTVTVVGSGTATAYGTATFQVPTRASHQYSWEHVLTAANAMTRSEADRQFSFYIHSTEPLAGYQHVTHSPNASYFENASVCRWTIQDAVSAVAPSAVLTHVHTTSPIMYAYPSAIEIHNFATTAVTYRFTVIESVSGNIVGEMNFPTLANASYTIPWAQIERTINWAPLSNQIHTNLVVSDPSGAVPAILLSHTVINEQLHVSLNMTTMCAVNRPVGLGGDGGLAN